MGVHVSFSPLCVLFIDVIDLLDVLKRASTFSLPYALRAPRGRDRYPHLWVQVSSQRQKSSASRRRIFSSSRNWLIWSQNTDDKNKNHAEKSWNLTWMLKILNFLQHKNLIYVKLFQLTFVKSFSQLFIFLKISVHFFSNSFFSFYSVNWIKVIKANIMIEKLMIFSNMQTSS